MKKIVASILCLAMFVSCFLSISVMALSGAGMHNFTKTNRYDKPFADVPKYEWYAETVQSAYEYGLVKGSSDTEFEPLGNITIAETITLACRIYSTYQDDNYAFRSTDPWYQRYVEYAVSNGIIERGQYNYYDGYATRAQFATVMANALPEKGLTAINNLVMGDVPDVRGNEAYAEAVYKLYNAGILTGSDEKGTFKPNTYIQRCEVATIATRMADTTQRKSGTLGKKLEVSNAPNPISSVTKPLSYKNTDTIEFQLKSKDPIRKLAIQNVSKLEGNKAAEFAEQSYRNSYPDDDEEWRFYEFAVHYVESEFGSWDVLSVGDVITSDAFYTASGEQVDVEDVAEFSSYFDGNSAKDTELNPGATVNVVIGILVNEDCGNLMLKVPYDEGRQCNFILCTSKTRMETGN